jgi:hypothetical protein
MPLNHTPKYAQLTDRQFELLGRVVVEWANLEFLLGCLLNRLLHTPEFLGRTYTDQLTSSRIEVAIREAIEIQRVRYRSRIVSEANLAAALGLLARIQSKRTLRNKIAHFCWSRSTDDAIFGTSFSGGLPGSAKHERSYASLTTTELAEAHQSFSGIVDELQTLVSSIPEMSEEQALAILGRDKEA